MYIVRSLDGSVTVSNLINILPKLVTCLEKKYVINVLGLRVTTQMYLIFCRKTAQLIGKTVHVLRLQTKSTF